MAQSTPLIYTVRKPGHHEDYARVIGNLSGGQIIRSPRQQWRKVLSASPIAFLDGDRSHIPFVPAIWLRARLGRRSIYLDVRSEFLLRSTPQAAFKRLLYRSLRALRHVTVVSIHKGAEAGLSPYIDLFINDIQLWDRPWLPYAPTPPPEWEALSASDLPLLLVPGRLNEKRCKRELFEYLEDGTRKIRVVVAGAMTPADAARIGACRNATAIPRYLEPGELLFLYDACDAVYCYYDSSVRRPSGVMGRAIQSRKLAVIRRGGHLDLTYDLGDLALRLDSLHDMSNVRMDPPKDTRNFDDSSLIVALLSASLP